MEASGLPIPVPQRSWIRKNVLGQKNRREEESAWKEEVDGDLLYPRVGVGHLVSGSPASNLSLPLARKEPV